MSQLYDFETTLKLRGKGEMDRAEDWIRDNIKGLWALEFLGMQQEQDMETGARRQVLHVRFMFGRKEDFLRFRTEYVEGKTPARQPAAPARKLPPKKKGLLAWLFE
ncbi:hypothetical protein [Indioceanicola profundi]|uniref:hypothetical protein n=1 Tax=Indioceanicola profundi TaxID=2220096 RepID=UPI000E6AC0B7|nr:hypothetical protein [Indioceanicola profundi]